MSISAGTVTCEGDRHKEAPKGIFGGSDGSSASMTKNPDSDQPVSLESKIADYEFGAGEVLQIRTPCGGGYGNPFERDPELVLSDVLDDFTSVKSAEEKYGVKINDDYTIDYEATEKLRAAAR